MIKNAKITSTRLEFEDHGIFTFIIFLKTEDGNCGFGSIALDAPLKDESGKFIRRQGTAFGLDMIMQIIKAVGVDAWEDLSGEHIRIKVDPEKWNGMANPVLGIGNIIKDEWVYLPK